MKTLIILVGCPCSGKSTYAKEKEYEGFVHISQDDLGKRLHFSQFLKSSYNGDNIILDRMNFNRSQRKKYLDIARSFGYYIHVVEFIIPLQVCYDRAFKRIDHPTISDFDTAKRVIWFFFHNYEKPEPDEYDTYEVIK